MTEPAIKDSATRRYTPWVAALLGVMAARLLPDGAFYTLALIILLSLAATLAFRKRAN